MLRMGQVHVMKHKHFVEGIPIRQIALEMRVSQNTTEKQKITGSRVHQQLVEDGFTVGITTAREYLAERRLREEEVYLPLEWWRGGCAQVDFFEVTVDVEGVRRKAWKFFMRLMYSGKDFAWLYERCNRIAFLDGHVRAFQYFGGLADLGIYDRLTAAVKRSVGLCVVRAKRATVPF
jgi:hypothetical protein